MALDGAKVWGLDLQVWEHNCVLCLSSTTRCFVQLIDITRLLSGALALLRDASHERTSVFFVVPTSCALDSLNLVVQVLHKLELLVGDLVFFLQFVIFMLKSSNCDLE